MLRDRGQVVRQAAHPVEPAAFDRTRSRHTIRSDLALIADEHAVLSWQCRILLEAVENGRPLGTLRRYIQGLLDAARNHFRSEERVMRATRFADADDHGADHERLLRDAAGVLRRVDVDPLAVDWTRVCDDIGRQLSEHQSRQDRELEGHIRRLRA